MYGVGMILATIATFHYQGASAAMEMAFKGALWSSRLVARWAMSSAVLSRRFSGAKRTR